VRVKETRSSEPRWNAAVKGQGAHETVREAAMKKAYWNEAASRDSVRP